MQVILYKTEIRNKWTANIKLISSREKVLALDNVYVIVYGHFKKNLQLNMAL